MWFESEEFLDNFIFQSVQTIVYTQLNGFVWFYDISNIVGYLMPNIFYIVH